MATARMAAGQKATNFVLPLLAVSAQRMGPQQQEQQGMRRSRIASREGASGSLDFSEMFNGILEDLEDEDPLDPFEVLGIEVQMLQLGRKGGKYGENGENGEVGTYRNHVFQNLRLKIQGSQLQHSKRLKVKWSRFTVGSR